MPPAADSGNLLRNIVLFGRMLRALGVEVTPTQILDFLAGLQHIDMRRREDVKNTACTILVNQPEHLPLFDRAFDLFWQARDKDELSRVSLDTLLQDPGQAGEQKRTLERILSNPVDDMADPDAVPEAEDPIIDKVYTYSNREVLRQKDFTELSPDELLQVKAMMHELVWDLEKRRTRRRVAAMRGAYLDMRRTFRQNMRFGGEQLTLARRSRKLKRRPLVVLGDISGSMERYARVLLQFIYVISHGLTGVEAFVFSTRLTRITRYLRGRDVDSVLDSVTLAVHDWSGGTRIGEALKTFNFEWGRRVLGQGATVLIISDGWDRGDPTLLGREIQRLQLSSQRLIWLNPLLGSPSYEPLTRGIVAALPFIDDFLPVHNLESLEQLGDLLVRLSEQRPSRRQAFPTAA